MWACWWIAAAVAADVGAEVASLDVPEGAELEIASRSFAGGKRVRVRLVIDGAAVAGPSVRMSVSPAGEVTRRSGQLPATIELRGDFSADRAVAWVRRLVGPGPQIGRARSGWRSVGGRAVAAWIVPTATRVFWLDTHRGELLGSAPNRVSVYGSAWATNPVNSPLISVPLGPLWSPTELVNDRVDVRSCLVAEVSESPLGASSCDVTRRTAEPNTNGDFTFAPAALGEPDPLAEVSMFHHIDRVSRWVEEGHGLVLPYAPIRAIANFPMANAFFGDFDLDGVPDLSFGDVDGADFAYDGDVVYHEFGHAIVAELAPDLPFVTGDELGLDWVGGSINEGAADVFSMLLTSDPRVGEFAGSAFGEAGPIRDLSTPRRCPDDLVGEVHADGEILGSFAWAAMSDGRIGPAVVEELLYAAVSDWDTDVDWPAVGRSFADAADDLVAAGVLDADGRAALDEHLLAANFEGCERIIDLDVSGPLRLYVPNLGLVGPLERLPGGVELELSRGDDEPPVVVGLSEDDDQVGWTLFGRLDAPVVHVATTLDALGLGFSVPETYDFAIDGDGAAELELGDDRVPPGRVVFLSLASRNLGDLEPFEFRFTELAVERVTPDPGLEEASSSASSPSGGCAVAGAPPTGWAALAALAAVGLMRRSRATPIASAGGGSDDRRGRFRTLSGVLAGRSVARRRPVRCDDDRSARDGTVEVEPAHH